ncbi:hypothetical protein, partial [Burkholderia mallei]
WFKGTLLEAHWPYRRGQVRQGVDVKGIFVLIHRKPQPLLTITMFVYKQDTKHGQRTGARRGTEKELRHRAAYPKRGLSTSL